MNHAYATHYMLDPDRPIAHVLPGWAENGKIPAVDLTVRDLHITNLPTHIRTRDGVTERYGNSIFVFETGRLCIAHLERGKYAIDVRDNTVLDISRENLPPMPTVIALPGGY